MTYYLIGESEIEFFNRNSARSRFPYMAEFENSTFPVHELIHLERIFAIYLGSLHVHPRGPNT